MALTQSTLRSTLAAIFSVDEKYIVPKQGNWFNPQDMLATPDKPSTWVAFRIDKGSPRTMPFLAMSTKMVEEVEAHIEESVTVYISTVTLQIVGTLAETLAQSVAHWMNRTDVSEAFDLIDASIIASTYDYTVLDFYQDGANNVLSYNVKFRVQWTSVVQSTADTLLRTANITG